MRMITGQLSAIPIIEEKEQEVDLKEEFEKREKTYKKTIDELTDTLDDLDQQEQTKR